MHLVPWYYCKQIKKPSVDIMELNIVVEGIIYTTMIRVGLRILRRGWKGAPTASFDSRLGYSHFGEQLRKFGFVGVLSPSSHGKNEISRIQPSSIAWPNLWRLVAHSCAIIQDIADGIRDARTQNFHGNTFWVFVLISMCDMWQVPKYLISPSTTCRGHCAFPTMHACFVEVCIRKGIFSLVAIKPSESPKIKSRESHVSRW